MRKIVLALFLSFAALAAGTGYAADTDGFDLGDMPPLPPPLLDDSPAAPPLTPPSSGSSSPLAAPPAPPPVSGAATAGSLAPPPAGGLSATSLPDSVTPAVPPLDAGTGAVSGGMDFASPLPPAPPIAPSGAPQAISLPGQLGAAPGAPGAAAPSVPETPRPGRIDGGRVNVRAGPNTQYESIAVLTSGAPVTVLARHGEWYKIVFPADQLASIHKNYVTADITGEIPEAGLPGVVNQDGAGVHAFYWDKSTVVGSLPKGAPVTIRQERGQWYRIVPPENARAFVFASYVRVDGNAAEIAADSAPAPVNPAVDLNAPVGADGKPTTVKLSKDQERVLELKESYYKRLQERFDAELAAEEAEEEAALEARRLQATQLDSALKDLDSRLSAIDQETTQRIDYIAREFLPQQTMVTGIGAAAWAPPDPAGGGYTGWVENIGRVGGAPAPHRLTKGGEVRFYLVSNQFNLDEYTNRRVWLNGAVEYAGGGAAAGVLNVDQIRILTELEIAEDMRQQQIQQYGSTAAPGFGSGSGFMEQQQQQPAADPYAVGGEYGSVTEYSPGGAVVMTGTPAPGAPMLTGGYGVPAPMTDPLGAPAYAPAPAQSYPAQGYVDPNLTPGMYAEDLYPTGSYPGTSGMTSGSVTGSAGGSDGMAVPAYIDPVTGAVYSSPPAGMVSEPYLVPGQVYSGSVPPSALSSSPQMSPVQPQMYQAAPLSAPAPQGGMSPSDPSQLPDVVGAGTQYYDASLPMGVGGNMTAGEVETDTYEQPIINEIAP